MDQLDVDSVTTKDFLKSFAIHVHFYYLLVGTKAMFLLCYILISKLLINFTPLNSPMEMWEIDYPRTCKINKTLKLRVIHTCSF